MRYEDDSMNVDFTRIKTFKMNFDGCKTYHEIGQIVREIEESADPPFLAILKTAERHHDEFKVAAVYENDSMHICDEDDIKVLIENFPEEWKQ